MCKTKISIIAAAKKVRERKACIYGTIFLQDGNKNLLDAIFREVSKTGDTSYISRRDCFFSYDIERDVFYSSQRGWGGMDNIFLTDISFYL